MKVLLIIGSLSLVIANGLIFYKNQNVDWRYYQTKYYEMAIQKTTDEKKKALLASRPIRIEQNIITNFGEKRVERCTTCHLAINDPRFKDAPHPFRFHKRNGHNFTIMGCTVCHEGNGHGLEVSDAHGANKFWNKPLYKKDFIEIGCAKCHPAPYLKETPLLAEGRKLFMTKACYGCHKNDGVSSGKLGVDLSFVGTKWPIEYIMTKIEKPRVSIPDSIMPAITMTAQERKALTVYLKSLTGENLVIGPVTNYVALEKWKTEKPVEVPVNIASGEKVFKERSCNACHTINGVGGKVGPNLSVYGLQRTIDWMIQHHIDPRSLVGGSRMPDFKFSKSELQALSIYLSSLEDKNKYEGKK